MGDEPKELGKHEPTADARKAAASIRSLHLALMAEGFTETQSLKILGYMLAGGKS